MKGQLVNQLQTQITDLEMFIQFLQVFNMNEWSKVDKTCWGQFYQPVQIQEESSVSVPLDTGCGCEKHEVKNTQKMYRVNNILKLVFKLDWTYVNR